MKAFFRRAHRRKRCNWCCVCATTATTEVHDKQPGGTICDAAMRKYLPSGPTQYGGRNLGKNDVCRWLGMGTHPQLATGMKVGVTSHVLGGWEVAKLCFASARDVRSPWSEIADPHSIGPVGNLRLRVPIA